MSRSNWSTFFEALYYMVLIALMLGWIGNNAPPLKMQLWYGLSRGSYWTARRFGEIGLYAEVEYFKAADNARGGY